MLFSASRPADEHHGLGGPALKRARFRFIDFFFFFLKCLPAFSNISHIVGESVYP